MVYVLPYNVQMLQIAVLHFLTGATFRVGGPGEVLDSAYVSEDFRKWLIRPGVDPFQKAW